MQRNSKVHFIPPIPKREQHVGIYCRVNTNSMARFDVPFRDKEKTSLTISAASGSMINRCLSFGCFTYP